MSNTKKTDKKRTVLYILRGVLAGVLVLCCFLPNIVRSAGEGEAQAKVLFSLGIIEEPDNLEEWLIKEVPVTQFRTYFLTLLGCGDPERAAEFYRDYAPEAAPGFISGSDTITGTQAFKMLLSGLGYDTSDLTKADLEALAESAGYGYIKDVSTVMDTDRLRSGTAAILLYETLFVRQNYTNDPVYRSLGERDSVFRAALLSNGLFDDVPEDIVPRFQYGFYIENSFFELPGESGSVEWGASYRGVTAENAAAYISSAEGLGWLKEGEYLVTDTETGAEKTLWLYYRTESQNKETGLVLSLGDGILEWALLKE